MRYTEDEDNLMYFLGEQDLFITSRVTDKISFLGESVFKYSPNSPTSFNVSMERLIIGYNYKGNHSLLIGKHHTPFSYWNDRYHHGRVFFPTVDRPLLFRQGLIEIHTTGLILQGLNLGKKKYGYQILVGNGIGSNDFSDDNTFKSVTAEVHAKPKRGMKLGLTGYMDKFSSDAKDHHSTDAHNDSIPVFDIFQLSGGAYFTYFRNKYEFLAEAHLVTNDNDSVGMTSNQSFYAYAGYRIKDKIVPYLKYDMVTIDKKELFFKQSIKKIASIGVRYEFSYLAVAKLEYNLITDAKDKSKNGVYFQMALGF
ncbi:MAG: hypothetical protein H6605_06000 [Flavobacteriales bacterium]|nr:hypothetical protein [Flavobacteriales bacterium]